jgi:hypothetical protein
LSGTPSASALVSAASSAAGANAKLSTGIAAGIGAGVGGSLLLALALFLVCKRASAKKAITAQPAVTALGGGGNPEEAHLNPLSVIHSR